MTFRWRADVGPTLNADLVALCFFRGSEPVLLRKPIFFVIFEGGPDPFSSPSPLDPHMALRQLFWLDFFLCFKDISFTLWYHLLWWKKSVKLISFLRFKYKSFTVVPFVMMKEVCCMGVTANPRVDVQICCVVACKQNHFNFLNSCESLQNIANVESLYATIVLYVGYSKEPSH